MSKKATVDIEGFRKSMARELCRAIKDNKWRNQKEAAHHLGIDRSEVSRLCKGDSSRFKVDRLIELMFKAGLEITFYVHKPIEVIGNT